MCFSPEASFIGGVAIISIGAAAIKEVRKPNQFLFAMIPLFFGFQQIAEGVVWLSLQNPEFVLYQEASTMAFLIMAQIFWPAYLPLTVLLMEENKKRKQILALFLVLGIIVALYYTYCLINFGVYPQIEQYHIRYYKDFPKSLNNIVLAMYLIASLTPLFVSSIKRMRYFGAFMFFSCAIAAIFYTQYLTSVWCFFAAILSGFVFWIVKGSKKEVQS
jgi:hypothetical protein